jgi:transposase-like protein
MDSELRYDCINYLSNMSRRKFTTNFKLNAIKLGKEKRNVAQAARELGVKASLIHRWKGEQQEFITHNSFPSHRKVKITDEQPENAELKKALGEAKMETEILKKAISTLFAAQIMRATRRESTALEV